MQPEIFLTALNFYSSREQKVVSTCFSVHVLELHMSRGMFTALSFQLCSAKLTGAALVASTVALFLVTINKSNMEN